MTSGTLNVAALLDKMTKDLHQQLIQKHLENPLLIGIHTGGVWVGEYLHKALELKEPMGILDISFYRDDFSQAGLNPKVQPSKLPCATENRHIILVDDVIMSGRTIRAALNEIFDYGRPASVTLVTLLDLQRRELPVQPDVLGATLTLGPDQCAKLTGPEPLAITIRQRT